MRTGEQGARWEPKKKRNKGTMSQRRTSFSVTPFPYQFLILRQPQIRLEFTSRQHQPPRNLNLDDFVLTRPIFFDSSTISTTLAFLHLLPPTTFLRGLCWKIY